MNKQKKYLAILLALIAAAALLGAGYFLARQASRSGPVTSTVESFEFEEEQVQETQAASVTKGIRIPGYSIIPIQANATDVKVELYNPEDNEVYFQISFYLPGEEESELLYESKLLKPGQHIYEITLTRGLPAGDHPITIQYSTFTADGEFSPRNGATVDCVLRAQ